MLAHSPHASSRAAPQPAAGKRARLFPCKVSKSYLCPSSQHRLHRIQWPHMGWEARARQQHAQRRWRRRRPLKQAVRLQPLPSQLYCCRDAKMQGWRGALPRALQQPAQSPARLQKHLWAGWAAPLRQLRRSAPQGKQGCWPAQPEGWQRCARRWAGAAAGWRPLQAAAGRHQQLRLLPRRPQTALERGSGSASAASEANAVLGPLHREGRRSGQSS